MTKKTENRVDSAVQSVLEEITNAAGHLQEAAESLPDKKAYEATRKRLFGLSGKAESLSVTLRNKAERENKKAERAAGRKAKLEAKLEKLQAELEKLEQ